MSMAICDKCSNFIDTDADPDSTYFDNKFICEGCRGQLTEAEHEEHNKAKGA